VQKSPELTARERDVLAALCEPYLAAEDVAFTEPASIRDIAIELEVSEAAVKQHLLHLYDKFAIHGGTDRRRLNLANQAIRLGLVSRAEKDPLIAARAALAARSWDEAYKLFAAATITLAEDLEALGEAAVWTARHEESIAARLRAYAVRTSQGQQEAAALVALELTINYVVRQQLSVAGGWLAKARRHLEGVPLGRAHGHLAGIEGLFAVAGNKLDAALAAGDRAFELGKKLDDRDLLAYGLTFRGCVLARRGKREEAMALLDEAMACAASGELRPLTAGIVYCQTLCTCLDVFDYGRALEWSDAVEKTRASGGECGLPGDCRVHRATVLAQRGEWAVAEREAKTAFAEAETYDLAHSGIASREIGMVRLRWGDLDGAAAAFRRARELGAASEPGASLLLLARGEPAAALGTISAALAEAAGNPLRRAALLPAQVEIALESGALETARAAGTELSAIAHDNESAMLRAAALHAEGCLAAASGQSDQAVRNFREGLEAWRQVESPYEAARTRLKLAQALRICGQSRAADDELATAQAAFVRLGALPDARRATAAAR
jgi:tetratricopeptide (TPR) repeat protein